MTMSFGTELKAAKQRINLMHARAVKRIMSEEKKASERRGPNARRLWGPYDRLMLPSYLRQLQHENSRHVGLQLELEKICIATENDEWIATWEYGERPKKFPRQLRVPEAVKLLRRLGQ